MERRRRAPLRPLRPAEYQDVPKIRDLFARLVADGHIAYEHLTPYGKPVMPTVIPNFEVSVATAGAQVVGVSWHELLDEGAARVVLLTDPRYDDATDVLLRTAQACLQVIAADGRLLLTEARGWLPPGEHGARLAAAYERQGWSRPTPIRYARLGTAVLKRAVLEDVVQQAQAAGVTFKLQNHEWRDLQNLLSPDGRPPHPLYRMEALWEARLDGRPVAVTGVYAGTGTRTISVEPAWMDDTAQSPLIARALLARLLLGEAQLPHILRGDGSEETLEGWVETPLTWIEHGDYRLEIDPERALKPWEDAMGFNPLRIWLLPGQPRRPVIQRDDDY